MIDAEIANALQGKDAWIMVKLNNLSDKDMISKLYRASRAGVKIRMVVRSICSLIPGVSEMSDNIEAVSIVGRFLEHSRIIVFCNGGDEQYYISSADWMPRNLDARIEVAMPVYDPAIRRELKHILQTQLQDNVKARLIDTKQDNRHKRNNRPTLSSQLSFYEHYRDLLIQ
jgi:polyphosphate kinase